MKPEYSDVQYQFEIAVVKSLFAKGLINQKVADAFINSVVNSCVEQEKDGEVNKEKGKGDD